MIDSIRRAPARFSHRTKTTFASLSVRNYRVYFTGQAISLCGSWMQTLANGWLVLQLTGSGTQVGLAIALQFLPLLLLTPVGGMLADRFSKRKILLVTQPLFFVEQSAFAILTLSGHLHLWMIYALLLLFGLINAIDNPARQAFVSELVGRDQVRNAVALNATANNLARAIGPSIGAVLISGIGIGFCYVADASSTLAVIIALLMIDARSLHAQHSQALARPFAQLMEGWRYVRKNRLIRDVLFMAVVIGLFSYEFQTTLPVFAQFAFASNASAYSKLWVAFGLGSVTGGLLAAGRKKVRLQHLVGSAILFGFSMLLAASMPSLGWAVFFMLFVGFFSINFTSLANTSLQLEAEPAMRGRVMSLWTMAMLGTTPIGGPVVGFIAEHAGARWGIIVGGVAALAAGLIASRTLGSHARAEKIPQSVRTADFAAALREEAKFK